MGNHHNRPQNQKNNAVQPSSANSQLKCPKCNYRMPAGSSIHQFAQHIRNCLNENSNNNQMPNNLHQMALNKKQSNSQHEKVPIDYSMTKFKWEKKPIKSKDNKILSMEISEVKKLSFQEKQYFFRSHLQKKRISWEHGADWMKIERNNILMTSFIQYLKVNMHKQVKIQFLGEKVNDAGGLLRQWIHMVIKQVFDESTGIFTIANCEDIMYKLKWDEDLDQQFSVELFHLFGTILGKAIFERIPVLCYLDRTILRQICGDPVKMQDIYGYDLELYKNWTFILESEEVQDLDVYFVIQKNTGETIQEIQLMPNGKNILVTDQNKFQFVDLCIQTQTMKKVQRSINAIRQGISKVIPLQLLNVFQPFELEMILYGVPFIQLDEWKQNTIYKPPYNPGHQVIKWFWTVMSEFDQEQLSNILHFCTGSSRTPVHGFKKLQSNRGNYSKFLIQSAKYEKANPYPKGHTCFNRLQLPAYPTLELLRTHLTTISKSNLDGVFGLD